MEKSNKFDFNTNWYELWMRQSKIFFDLTEKKLNEVFAQNEFINPEEHLHQVNQWLEELKQQWNFSQLKEEQKASQAYWNMMNKMCNDASELMMCEWVKRTREQNPVKTIRDLYELWLNCCHEVYHKSLQSKAYQEAYGEFMNVAFKLWHSAMTR